MDFDGMLKNFDKCGCCASVLLNRWFPNLSIDDAIWDEQHRC
jgi:hypothetical protein